ncbi:MAG TPA: NADPH-dependent F420 reductase [Actinomycetota bacterium]|nr:NADPH-dependent F420 reductase [Actinomycetota bacterium]
MTIAIIGGTGDEGFGLALRLSLAGHGVVIGSRSEERGQAAADRAREILELGFGSGGRGEVSGTSNQEAAAACETVFMTVPYAGQAEIYRSIKSALRPAALVCDTTTPLATAVGGRAWEVITPWAGSAAEQAKALLPSGARLVAGFHTVSAEQLQALEEPVEGDVLLCGVDAEAKAEIGALVEAIPNLRWVDAGSLSMARIVERLTGLMVSINRKYGIHHAGVAITGRKAWGRPEAEG